MSAVVIIRHGDTEWSRTHRHTGRTDLPLTPEGEAQVRPLRRRLAMLPVAPFTQVWTSPLRRASDTCALAGFVDVSRVEPNLREWDCGDYEGLTLEEIHAQRPGWDLFRDGAPGGESPAQIDERVDALVSAIRRLDGSVALFSHGHLLCALAAKWIGLHVSDGARFRLDAAAFGILDVEHHNPTEPSIAAWNVGDYDDAAARRDQVPVARRRTDGTQAA